MVLIRWFSIQHDKMKIDFVIDDVNGKTIQYTKTTYNPQGNIIHVKDKINVATYP
jgi:tRNA(Phe) wybutosine-synthesizing methylase Tyw3